jgi:tRNA(fMet)-specific endonuclease VapC
MYLLDTNTVSYYFRGEGSVAQRIQACRQGDLAVSVLTDFELRFGALKAGWSVQRWNALTHALQPLLRVPLTTVECHAAAAMRNRVERPGRPVGLADLLIAATAHAHRMTLVSRNTQELGHIPDLNMENWF